MMPTRLQAGDPGAKYKKLSRKDKDGFLDIQSRDLQENKLRVPQKNYEYMKQDLQFEKPPPKFPTKAIVLAVTLFVVGTILLVIGALLLSGVIDAKYGDRTWPVLILGGIMFIPGFYHVRIAYYAYQGYAGYSYEDIPEFE